MQLACEWQATFDSDYALWWSKNEQKATPCHSFFENQQTLSVSSMHLNQDHAPAYALYNVKIGFKVAVYIIRNGG